MTDTLTREIEIGESPQHPMRRLLRRAGILLCLASAAAFGAVLYTVVTGDSVVSALTGLVQRALSTAV